jgi:hypothetical protein
MVGGGGWFDFEDLTEPFCKRFLECILEYKLLHCICSDLHFFFFSVPVYECLLHLFHVYSVIDKVFCHCIDRQDSQVLLLIIASLSYVLLVYVILLV